MDVCISELVKCYIQDVYMFVVCNLEIDSNCHTQCCANINGRKLQSELPRWWWSVWHMRGGGQPTWELLTAVVINSCNFLCRQAGGAFSKK